MPSAQVCLEFCNFNLSVWTRQEGDGTHVDQRRGQIQRGKAKFKVILKPRDERFYPSLPQLLGPDPPCLQAQFSLYSLSSPFASPLGNISVSTLVASSVWTALSHGDISKDVRNNLVLNCTFKPVFNWRVIALQCCVSACRPSAWINGLYTYLPSVLSLRPTSLPSHPP